MRIRSYQESDKIRTRSHELNKEFYEQRKKLNSSENEDFGTLAAFIFVKIAELEIENENLRREIQIVRGLI